MLMQHPNVPPISGRRWNAMEHQAQEAVAARTSLKRQTARTHTHRVVLISGKS